MCATLHRNSTIAAPARTSRLGATAWRQPFGDPPGQGRGSPVRFDRSRVDRGRSSKLFLLISPESPSGLALPNRDQPRSPVCASAGPEPSPSNPGSAIASPAHPAPATSPAQRASRPESLGIRSPQRGHPPHQHDQIEHDNTNSRHPHGPGPPLPGGEPLAQPAPLRTGDALHPSGSLLSPAAPHRRGPGPASPHLGGTPGSALRAPKLPPGLPGRSELQRERHRRRTMPGQGSLDA
jgi:hypothetical protein